MSLVFLSKKEGGNSEGNINSIEEYLRIHKAPTEWYTRNDSEESVLLATVSLQSRHAVDKQAFRCSLNIDQWAPMDGGDYLRQNIPQRPFRSLIQNDNPSQSHRLYIVSEDDIIFYVGQADNPIKRLCSRLDPYVRGDDKFGRFLRQYVSDLFSSWRVQLITLQDCLSFVVGSFLLPGYDAETIRSEVIEKYTNDNSWAKNQAERVLIWLYQPCLNNQFNPFPTHLPAKYSDFPG